ncbi:hypothetical protein ACFPRL_27090 [Pseudoclavibacter helvolus]
MSGLRESLERHPEVLRRFVRELQARLCLDQTQLVLDELVDGLPARLLEGADALRVIGKRDAGEL